MKERKLAKGKRTHTVRCRLDTHSYYYIDDWEGLIEAGSIGPTERRDNTLKLRTEYFPQYHCAISYPGEFPMVA